MKRNINEKTAKKIVSHHLVEGFTKANKENELVFLYSTSGGKPFLSTQGGFNESVFLIYVFFPVNWRYQPNGANR